jgi:membrane carboxypeptidase/penicillin-binding protein
MSAKACRAALPHRPSVVHAEYVAETVRQLVFAQYGDGPTRAA